MAVHIGQYFLNSMKVVIPSLILTLALSSMTSYVLARFQFVGNRALFYLFMAGMLFPIFLALVPLFFLAKDLRLLNTFTGLTLVYTAYSLPFTIFFLTGFFKTLPSELHEAALIDGANEYQVFFRVMLPLAQPGLVTMGIFNFLGMWNQFILPLVLMTERDNYVLATGLVLHPSSAVLQDRLVGAFRGAVHHHDTDSAGLRRLPKSDSEGRHCRRAEGLVRPRTIAQKLVRHRGTETQRYVLVSPAITRPRLTVLRVRASQWLAPCFIRSR